MSSDLVVLPCLSQQQLESLKQQGYDFDNSTRALPVNATALIESIPLNCLYAYNVISEFALGSFFGGFFTGNLTSQGDLNSGNGSSVLQKIYQNGNHTLDTISSSIVNVSQAITAFMRINGDPYNSKPALGTVHEAATCIAVHWAWFTGALCAASLTLLFHIIVAIKATTQGRRQNWKSSPLPLLFHGLQPSLQVQFERTNGLEEMERMAKDVKVQAVYTNDHGWQLVEV